MEPAPAMQLVVLLHCIQCGARFPTPSITLNAAHAAIPRRFIVHELFNHLVSGAYFVKRVNITDASTPPQPPPAHQAAPFVLASRGIQKRKREPVRTPLEGVDVLAR